MKFKICAGAALVLSAYATAALADEAKPQSAIETITVDAQRASVDLARMVQAEAPNFVNVLTVEEMRKLPDVNIAEAVRRIPGVQGQNDTGEGRYVNIRGLDANLNSATYGGMRLPPTTPADLLGGHRAVSLDTIPTGLVGSITVTKSNLPEQDAEALGGTIDIAPPTAPRNGKGFVDIHAGSGLETLRKTGIIDLSLTAGGRFGGDGTGSTGIQALTDKPISLVFTTSYYEDKRGVDDVEGGFIDGAPYNSPSQGTAGIEQRFYQYHRQRMGAGVDLGVQKDATNSFFARAFQTGYTETVLRNRMIVNLDGSPTQSGSNFTDGITGGGFDKTLRDEKERNTTTVLAVGGKSLFGDKVWDYRVGQVTGAYKKLYDYNSDFNFTPNSGTATYNYNGNNNTPLWKTSLGNAYLNPANYTLASFKNSTEQMTDKEFSANTNFKTPVSWLNGDEESFKTGLNARIRTRDDAQPQFGYSNLPSLALSTIATGPNVNYYLNQYANGPAIPNGVLQGLYGSGTLNKAKTASKASDDKENVYAAYGQYQYRKDKLLVTGGVRVETTQGQYGSNGYAGDGSVSFVNIHNNYTNFFPSLQARYQLQESQVLRASYSTAIGRPGFNQLTPFTQVDLANKVVTQGNPTLKPTTANSFDVAFEQYLDHGGIVSIGLFDKEFQNYAVTGQLNNQAVPNLPVYAGLNGVARTVNTFTTVSGAYARGLELAYEQRYTNLPGAWSGLGTGLNYTLVNSDFLIRPGQHSSLPSTAKNTVNASVFYEKDGLNLRLSYYYLSSNLTGVGGDPTTDTFTTAQKMLDLGSSYTIDKTYSVYFNAKNLTNYRLGFYEGFVNRPIQMELYGPTFQAGININLR